VRAMRPFVIAFALCSFAAPLSAQFTSTVSAPRRERPAVVQARTDSVRRADSTSVVERMTSMREWVDSAAVAVAANAPPATETRQDTVATATVSTGAIENAQQQAAPTTTFTDGAPAPATATPLPFLALLGLGSLLAGAALRRRTR
jgi:hypothetical protein